MKISPQDQIQKEQHTSFNKTFFIAVVVIGLLVAGVAGVFAVMGEQDDVSNNVVVEEENQGDIDTSDWKTYRNEEYGFEFWYPTSYGSFQESPNRELDCDFRVHSKVGIGHINNIIGIGISCISEPDVYIHNDNYGEGKEVSINDSTAYLYDYVSPVNYKNKEVYVLLPSGLYVTLIHSTKGGYIDEDGEFVIEKEVTMEELKSIVSTFRFIDSETVNSTSYDLNGVEVSFDKPEGATVVEDVEQTFYIYTETDPFLYTYDSLKIIPNERAKKLGQKDCYYGERGILEVCDAVSEYGISFGVVSAPVTAFTNEIDENIFPSSTATVLGKEVTTYTTGIEGYADTTYFVPLDQNRTLLIHRKDYDPNSLDNGEFDVFPSNDEFEKVIKSLKIVQ